MSSIKVEPCLPVKFEDTNDFLIILIMVHFLYHLSNVFTNCSMNIDQLVVKLLARSHIGVGRKKFKVPIVEKSSSCCWAINEQ
jgi:hypothetical protein